LHNLFNREINPMVNEVNANELDSILSENKVVFVDCHAVWCGPCKTLSPILDELSEKFSDKGVKVVKLDVDQNREFSMENQITGVPSVLVYSEGKRVVFDDGSGRKMDKLVGVMPPEVYNQIAENLIAQATA
jgi:thioredoxin 1